MKPLDLSGWTLADVFEARRELQKDYWSATPNVRVLLEKQLVELEIELLRREKEAC